MEKTPMRKLMEKYNTRDLNDGDIIIKDILNIRDDIKPKNFWVGQNKIPILMKKQFHEYYGGIVPIEDTFCLNINKNTPFHMLVVGKTGRQKTRMIKNIVRGYYKAGYKILYFEPKGFEVVDGIKAGKGKRLPIFDKNETKNAIDIVSYTPVAYKEHVDRIGNINTKKTNFYSIDISMLDYTEIWASFGCPIKGSEIIATEIKNKNYDLNSIKRKIRMSSLMAATKNVSVQAIESLEGMGVFSKKYKPIPLKRLWSENKWVTINYHARMGRYMNTDIGLIIRMAKEIGQAEKIPTKKLLIFDDAFMYAGAMAYGFAKAEINFAQNEIANCQYNYRSFGIDSIILIQNLDSASIHPTIIEGRDEFLLTRTGNSEILSRLIPQYAYFLVTNQNSEKGRVLVSDKAHYYFEWVYCTEESVVVSGYPFDCMMGHGGKSVQFI